MFDPGSGYKAGIVSCLFYFAFSNSMTNKKSLPIAREAFVNEFNLRLEAESETDAVADVSRDA